MNIDEFLADMTRRWEKPPRERIAAKIAWERMNSFQCHKVIERKE